MPESILSEITRLRRLDVAGLRAEWERLYGEPARSNNWDYLFRRLAWRVQELAHGGRGDLDLARLEQLGQDAFDRATSRPRAARDANPAACARPSPGPAKVRALRQPVAGTVLVRQYKGRELRLTVLEDGYELDGVRYGSLSEAARAATGSRWNGWLFWGLTDRKRKR